MASWYSRVSVLSGKFSRDPNPRLRSERHIRLSTRAGYIVRSSSAVVDSVQIGIVLFQGPWIAT